VNPQERTRLGGTKVEVTRLGLGLAPLAGLYRAVGREQAYATIERAWELGLRYFDTAPLYGSGLSERRAGQVLGGKPRSEFTLSTKVGRRLVPSTDGDGEGSDGPNQEIWAEPASEQPVWDFSHSGTLASHAESLDRLGLDRVDVLHIHDPYDHYPKARAEALPALVELRAQGHIGAVSVGMNEADMLADFARTGDLDCLLLAGRYTLLDQSGLAELLPLCTERGISVIAGGVYNSGLLADPRPGATYDYVPTPAAMLDRALAVQEVCARYDVPLRAAASQFPLGHPAVASVVIGARSPEEVADAVAMFTIDIPGQLWRDLKRVGLLPEEVPVP
jgi:D-threo-aldose 1-dehydrogenase